jgi:hypothetical protein
METKNVKIPTDLIDLVKARAPDVPPGETLLAIYKEYEKLEQLAKCLDKNADLSKVTVLDVVSTYLQNGKQRNEATDKSIDEMKSMLKGLEKFFTMIRAPNKL